ncbi:hypothetical protein N0V90_007256 [Kalmusia sp. IMI 367209]|nr:hypothetical protein N0V90_007256 [Kalmusia sp. IMI 367209]
MTIFNSKQEFFAHGLDQVQPRQHHISQDCAICLEPLDLVQTASGIMSISGNEKPTSRFHSAVRIKSCQHIHGTECLLAFLDVGNTCPSCSRMLFIPPSEQPITQEDIDTVLRNLGHVHGENVLMRMIARYMQRAETAGLKSRQQAETMIAMARIKDEEKAKKDRENLMLGYDDFLDSDSEWSSDGGLGGEVASDNEGDEDEDDASD